MTTPVMRYAIDWDGDLFINYGARSTDGLNILHTGLTTDAPLVNLHWNYVNISVANSATSVAFTQEETEYGLRKLRCVTGTGTTAGAYFGRTGSTNDFNVTNATAYTAVFWVKADVGSVGFTAVMENSTGSQTFTSSTSWQKVTWTFTTTNITTAFKITKTNSATNVTFETSGFMIVAGSAAPNGFNIGLTSNLYDVITSDVKSARWDNGRSDWRKNMIDEGTITYALDNSTRRYSPEYSAGPLFGSFAQQARTTVDIQTPGGTTYNRLFTGWASTYQPAPGKTRNREATIPGNQGRFQLDTIAYTAPDTSTVTVDTVITDVIETGFTSAATALQAVLNRSELGAGYLVDPAAIMTLDTGVSSIPVSGEDWGGVASAQSNSARAIDSLMKVEQGYCFIDRSGVVKFFNRDHYRDPALAPSATAVSLDSDALDSNYSYGQAYFNVVSMTYRPNTVRTDIVWQTKTPIRILPRLTSVIDVKFEYSEGKKLTATVNPFDGGVNASTYVAYTGTLSLNSQVDVSFEGKNGRGTLTVKNRSYTKGYVTVILRGDITESYGGEIVEAVDSAGIVGRRIELTENSRLITDKDTAANFTDYLLNIYKNRFGQFNSFTLDNKDDARLNKIISLSLGSRVTLSEYQTDHSDDYYLIKEAGTWMPGSLHMTYTPFPLSRINYGWIMGASVLGTDTHLAY